MTHLEQLLNMMREAGWEEGDVDRRPSPADYSVQPNNEEGTTVRIGGDLRMYFLSDGSLFIHAAYPSPTKTAPSPAPPRREFKCKDCEKDVRGKVPEEPDYMVWDRLWTEAHREGENKRGFLCLRCLQVRLGRKLTPEDFKGLEMNERAKEMFHR